ncbi:hypothetical protein TIFTF001_034260 [Ficus carica]|uniref:Uncharacterized protein n=1 Tax=Ficus carica TaxID=3494 RepID=A0AA88DZY2_FICCA|nr:hypothetical protein TIFTF001_034260 [Ficus carica]
MCGARESKRKRETYQFHGRGCGRRGSGVGSGGWVSRKRLEGGVTAEIGGERKRERLERE